MLEDAGFTTIVQAWDFRAGTNFAIDMHDALQRADRVLPLFSEAYLSSAFGEAEWAAAFADDPTGRHGRLLPVRIGDCRPEGLLRVVVYVDVVGQDEAEAKRRLLTSIAPGRAKPETPVAFPGAGVTSGSPRPYPGRLPAVWNVPARNSNFTGRDDELETLRDALSGSEIAVAVFAVAGLGGVGKTQLAVEHAWRRAPDYNLVWWVPAEIPAAVAGSLASLAERLGLPTEDPAAIVSHVHAELATRDRWLVVFDNAENPGALAPYLPAGGAGQVLVTSRNPAWRARATTLDLEVLPEPDAVAFLLARTGSDDPDSARAVAEELGLLPLALEQAGAYVEETGMGLDDYWDLLTSRRGEMLVRGTPASYRQTVAATFGLAYRRAREESSTAARVLETCALLAPDDIPTELVASGDPLADEDALSTLRRLALLRRQGDSITVHRVVGAVVREQLSADEAKSRAQAVIATLRGAFPHPADDHRSWPRSAALLPHILALSQYAKGTPELGHLLDSAGVYLWSRAQFRSAYEVLQQALAILEAANGPDHHEVARTLSNLGPVLRDLGDLVGARELLERALAILEAAHGPNHPEVARTLGYLGPVLRDLGDIERARNQIERALAINEAAFGPDHPEVARTLGNLGTILHDAGDLVAARKTLERALGINEGSFGPDHPEVARTLGNLALALRAEGDLVGARERQERALSVIENAYGPSHPQVAITIGNLGLVLWEDGDLVGARQLLERALALNEAAYSPDHPQVARSLANLGVVLQALGDSTLVSERKKRALPKKKDSKAARTLANMTSALSDLDDLSAAREGQERALGRIEAVYTPNHPQVAITLGNLGLILWALGDVVGARDRLARALSIFQLAYGTEHPHTRAARSALDAFRSVPARWEDP